MSVRLLCVYACASVLVHVCVDGPRGRGLVRAAEVAVPKMARAEGRSWESFGGGGGVRA